MKNIPSYSRRHFILSSMVTAVTPWLGAGDVFAAVYPTGPIVMMVSYPAGGASDVSARILSVNCCQFRSTT